MSNILRHWSKPVLSCVNAHLVQLHNVRNFCLLRPSISSIIPTTTQSPTLLRPTLSSVLAFNVQSAGIKHVAVPKKRCRHCYFVVKDEQRFVMCTANPRHYMAQKMPNKKWGDVVFTHATTGSSSRGRGHGSREMKTQLSFRLDY